MMNEWEQRAHYESARANELEEDNNELLADLAAANERAERAEQSLREPIMLYNTRFGAGIDVDNMPIQLFIDTRYVPVPIHNEKIDAIQAECERLREALCFLNTDHLRLLARYFDHHYPDDPQTQVQDDLRAWADKIAAALHPTTEGDEDE